MTDILNKFLQIGLISILGLSLIFFALFYINGESMADFVMYWAYILLAITLALLLVFPIKHFIEYPKQGIQFLIALGAFLLLYGVSYALASDATNATVYEINNISGGISRMIGAGMIMAYIIGALALIILVYFGILKAFK